MTPQTNRTDLKRVVPDGQAVVPSMAVNVGPGGTVACYFHPELRVEDAVHLRRVLAAWAIGVPYELPESGSGA